VKELDWKWPELALVLVNKLAPAGLVITRHDLGALPHDRVLIEDRGPTQIRFTFVSLHHAQLIRKPLANAGAMASVSELQGRWMKICAVVLWKLRKEGCVLTRWDRDAVPSDKTLLMHGHRDDLELRFVPRNEAGRIAKFELEQEGKHTVETIQ